MAISIAAAARFTYFSSLWRNWRGRLRNFCNEWLRDDMAALKAVERIAIAAALAAAVLAGSSPALGQGGPTVVKADRVISQPLEQTVPVFGRVVARRQGDVAARIAGTVSDVFVEVGDRVEAGAPLAKIVDDRLRLESDLARAELAAAQAQLETAGAELALREQERARLYGLRGSAAFSPARLEDKDQEIAVAKTRVVAAKARLQQSMAQLKAKEWDVSLTDVRAPYPGVVTVRHTSPGAYVSIGDPVVTMIDDSMLEVEADVPTERLGGLAIGQRVAIVLDDGSRHAAEVRALVPQENPSTRTRAVRFVPDFGETAKPLAAEQNLTLHIPVGAPRQIIAVHKDAVLVRGGATSVLVIEDGKVVPRPVRLGEAVNGRFEVLEGLEAGELVVVRGNERLQPGQSVSPEILPAGAPVSDGAS